MKILLPLTDINFYGGVFVGDYKEKFADYVTEILATSNSKTIPSVETRKDVIVAITEAYMIQVGEQPDGVQLQRLANWLLLEDLTNSHPDKVTLTEYPIMTNRQLRGRYSREVANERLEYTLTEQEYLGRKKESRYIEENQYK